MKNNLTKMVSFRLPIEDYAKLCLISDKLFNDFNVSKTIKYLIYIYLKNIDIKDINQ